MCFSATASFAASVVLTGAGAATLKKVHKKREIPMAMIPIFFGVQQFIEGVQWLSPLGSLMSDIALYGFLFFAFLFWPVYLPYAILRLEMQPVRREILKMLLVIGMGVAVYLLYFMITTEVVTGFLQGNLYYSMDAPLVRVYIMLYVIATFGASLLSSERPVFYFGVALASSFLFSILFYYRTFISVWCFFAAWLSLIIYRHFWHKYKMPRLEKLKF